MVELKISLFGVQQIYVLSYFEKKKYLMMSWEFTDKKKKNEDKDSSP